MHGINRRAERHGINDLSGQEGVPPMNDRPAKAPKTVAQRVAHWMLMLGAAPVGVVLVVIMGLVGTPTPAAASGPVAVARPPATPSPTIAAGALTISERTPTTLRGTFRHEGIVASFNGQLVGSDQVVVHVEVNGLALDVTGNLTTQEIVYDGHGNALSLPDRTTLQGLTRALVDNLGRDVAALPPHLSLLVRTVSYWSEAPVGYKMPTKKLGPPVHRQASTLMVAGQSISAQANDCQEALAARAGEAESSEPLLVAAECQVSDDDGVTNLYHNCTYFNNTNWHDATDHCFEWLFEPAGPCSDDCLGHCGAGCWAGVFAYTQDCADHDSCCRIHQGCLNPQDSSCGDEYGEAADDTFWGSGTCGGLCRP